MPETDLDEHATARLVRAAMSYAGKSVKDIAKATGIEYDALRNYRGPARPTRTPLEKRLAIGRACEVPEWFMEGGFANAPLTSADDLAATLDAIQERLGELEIWRSALELEEREPHGEEDSEDPPAQERPQS